VNVRTTIDIPDALFREIKAKIAQRGEALKTFMLRAAKAELEATSAKRGKRVQLPLVKSKEKSYGLTPERIAELHEEEDLEVLARH
jgi:hypothetical protein